MKAKLNKRYLDSLESTDKMYKVWDSETKGLFVRVLPSGKRTFALFYRVNGKGRDYTLGQYGSITLEQAKNLAKEKLGEVAKGVDVQSAKKLKASAVEREKFSTLKGFIDLKFGGWSKANQKGAKEHLRVLNTDFEVFHDKRLDMITKWDLDVWTRNAMRDGLKPATINRRVATLKGVLTKAEKWGVIDSSPLKGTERLSVDDKQNIRFLSPDEERVLREGLDKRQDKQRQDRLHHNEWLEERGRAPMEELSGTFTDYLKPMVLLALNTGLRRGELFKLEWSDIQLNQRNLVVQGSKSKSGKTRHVPLNDEAFSILVAWRNQVNGRGLVFPSPTTGEPLDNIATSWKNLMKATGIQDFRFHDLRHTFASNLVMSGVDLNTVRELLGHSDLKMTLIYAHLAPEHKAAAVARLSKN